MELYPGVAIFRRREKEEMILSKTEYKKGFLYRFADPGVGKLARGLSPIRRKMVDLDRSLLDIDIWVGQHNGEGSNDRFVKEYTTLKKSFSSKNMEFFLRSAGLVESGWDSKIFDELKGEYFSDIKKLGKALRSIVENSNIKDCNCLAK
jgi:hypothetical protein